MATTAANSGPDPLDVEIGLSIRRLREGRRMSQSRLGEAIGITFQQIQKYERGTNRISASMLVRAARALDVQPADLLPRTDAAPLPPSASLLTLRGATKLLEGYAALGSRHRRAVLLLVKALREAGAPSKAEDGEDAGE